MIMSIYDIIHMVKNMDNMDRIEQIIMARCFQTSVIDDETKREIEKSGLEFLAMGESDLYNWTKTFV